VTLDLISGVEEIKEKGGFKVKILQMRKLRKNSMERILSQESDLLPHNKMPCDLLPQCNFT
jgi:hypothetical protein